MIYEKAKKAVDAIVEDLEDLRGLRQVWDEIDDETQKEIKERWTSLIVDYSRVTPTERAITAKAILEKFRKKRGLL